MFMAWYELLGVTSSMVKTFQANGKDSDRNVGFALCSQKKKSGLTRHPLICARFYLFRYGPITKGYFLPGWLDLAPEEMYKRMARQGKLNKCPLPAAHVRNLDFY